MKSAAQYFGGKEQIVRAFDTVIKNASARAGLIGTELGNLIGLEAPSRILQLQERGGILNFTFSEVMAMITQLGIAVERIMVFHDNLSSQDRKEWAIKMGTAGAVAPGNTHATFDENLAIELFVRLQAVEDVFSGDLVPAT